MLLVGIYDCVGADSLRRVLDTGFWDTYLWPQQVEKGDRFLFKTRDRRSNWFILINIIAEICVRFYNKDNTL